MPGFQTKPLTITIVSGNDFRIFPRNVMACFTHVFSQSWFWVVKIRNSPLVFFQTCAKLAFCLTQVYFLAITAWYRVYSMYCWERLQILRTPSNLVLAVKSKALGKLGNIRKQCVSNDVSSLPTSGNIFFGNKILLSRKQKCFETNSETFCWKFSYLRRAKNFLISFLVQMQRTLPKRRQKLTQIIMLLWKRQRLTRSVK